MSNRSGKGSVFERDICRRLSEWWSPGRSDIFWRTGGSGGRAKRRGRVGLGTYGQDGDIGATDPIGAPLIETLTIECKRGFNKFTIADLLDWDKGAAQQKFEEWLQQAVESHEQAKSHSWVIIHKRDKRKAMIYLPYDLLLQLKDMGCFDNCHRGKPTPLLTVTANVRTKRGTAWGQKRLAVAGLHLDVFLKCVQPKHIRLLHGIGK